MAKYILIPTLGFAPNIGGLETHLSDLVKEINSRGIHSIVLTLQPLTSTKSAKYIERQGFASIIRMPVFRGLFYKLVKSPLLEFLYLSPGFVIGIFVLLLIKPQITTIHSHGLVTGLISIVYGKIFNKKIITTTHSQYNFSNNVFSKISAYTFKNSDSVLCLSNISKKELVKLGVSSQKIQVFTYWIDLNLFKNILPSFNTVRLKPGSVLFVGRLVPEKGVDELIKAAALMITHSHVYFIGTGPMEEAVKNAKNCTLIGTVSQSDLPNYYSAAKLLVIPSTHDEGFGRVVIESLACGLPVIASNRGGLREALDSSVGWLIEITPKNIANCVKKALGSKTLLNNKIKNSRFYVKKKFSAKNSNTILNTYI